MTQKNILLLLLVLSLNLLSQVDKKKSKRVTFRPFMSGDYFYQGNHNLTGVLGVCMYYGNRHSYPALGAGFNAYNLNNTVRIVPTYYFEKFFQLKVNKGWWGPIVKAGYTSYKSLGQKDNYLSADFGFRFSFFTFFTGYNFLLDGKKDFNEITPYRVGIKFP